MRPDAQPPMFWLSSLLKSFAAQPKNYGPAGSSIRVESLSALQDGTSFIRAALGVRQDTTTFRAEIVRAFEQIHRAIPCAHQEAEFYILAHVLLSLGIPGPIIELGCYKGGSTAKLSLVARATGRQLYACDSFTGLPKPDHRDSMHVCISGRIKRYAEGDYCGRLDEVITNVSQHGAIEVCKFIQGPYARTLPDLNFAPAFIFMDVDLVESARQCLLALWPRLHQEGKFFTHEASSLTFLKGLLDGRWWHEHLGCCQPIVIGAGYGFGPHAANLAYLDRSEL